MIRPRALAFLALSVIAAPGIAQETLPDMPRYDRYERLRSTIAQSYVSGAVNVRWAADGKSFTFRRANQVYRFDLAAAKETPTDSEERAPAAPGGRRRPGGGVPERGRQASSAPSPNGKLTAKYHDRNLFIVDGQLESPITTDGSEAKRIKYGVASWVYGEELGVREAMWWSPDSAKLAYYRFDESQVLDFFLALDQTKIQSKLDQEPYPKAGAPNPVVSLRVYDVKAKTSVDIQTNFAEPDLGHYVYDVRWSPSGTELWFNRTNRKQNVMEVCAADPATGACRVVVREEWKTGWVENHPRMTWLADKKRFILRSSRTGFANLYLMDDSGKLLQTLTTHDFDVDDVVSVDESAGVVYYTGRNGLNPYLQQLNRVGLDGKNDVRLTNPDLSHSVQLAPTGGAFVDIASSLEKPATTRVIDANGKVLATIGTSDLTKFDALGLKKVERITFLAADGKTLCYGTLHYPSDFDHKKKYPLIVSVYGGPESGGAVESFQTPNAITELGFLYATFDGRGTRGRGKAFLDAVYKHLGVVEIDDQAAGVKELTKRPYVDGKRVGIYGTSYGGYASAMAILRHPDVFQVASASSSVTQWGNYDSIYTERYMDVPQDNPEGYEQGSAMTYAGNLKGHLLLYFGTADNNVHPSNTIQLVQALNRAGKRYDMQVGPDLGHTSVNMTRMWEYFVTHLILRPQLDPIKAANLAQRLKR